MWRFETCGYQATTIFRMIEPTNRTFGTTEPNFWLGNAIPTARILKIPGQFSTLQQNIPSIPIICPQTYPIILIDFSCQ